jgi:hypothetical protein
VPKAAAADSFVCYCVEEVVDAGLLGAIVSVLPDSQAISYKDHV